MSAEKIRVYDLAKELNLPNKDVIDLLKKNIGVVVKSHSSSISADDAESLKKSLKPKTQEKKVAETKNDGVITSTPLKPRKSIKIENNEQKEDSPQKYTSSAPKAFEKKEFRPAPREYQSGQKGQYQSERPKFQGDRPRFQNGERPKFQGDRPRFQGDRPRFQSGDRPRYQGDRPPFRDGQKPPFERKPFGERGERKPFEQNQDGQRQGTTLRPFCIPTQTMGGLD